MSSLRCFSKCLCQLHKLLLRRNPAAAPAQAAAQNLSAPVEASEDSKYITIKSPIIGTFYRKPSPDKPVFVEVGT